MSRLLVVLRFIVVSPELLVILAGTLLATMLGEVVKSWLPGTLKDDLIKYVAVLPLAGSAWALDKGRNLLFPDGDRTRVLQQWPDYWQLKYGFNVTILYSLLFSVVAFVAWAGDWQSDAPYPQIAMATALVGAFVNFLSCYYARIEVDEAVARLVEAARK